MGGDSLQASFPGQHHSVAHGQADILNAGIGLNHSVESHNRVSVGILRIEHFAAPEYVVDYDQATGFKQGQGSFVVVGVVRLVRVDKDQIQRAR